MTPTIDSCLVCEFIRPELNGKLILFGYFGACPNVDIRLQRLDLPATLTFLITGRASHGPHKVALEIVDDDGQRVVTGTGEQAIDATPPGVFGIAPALLPVFGRSSVYFARVIVDGVERYRGQFRISAGSVGSSLPAEAPVVA